MQDNRYVVLLARPDNRDPMALAKALAAARKTPLQDQMLSAKTGWGILEENLGYSDAKTLVETLRASGVECVACPSTALVQLPAVEPATTLQALPASPPVLVATAAIPISHTTTKTVREGPTSGQKILSTAILLGTGLPIKIGGKERMVEKTQEHKDREFYLDLLYKEPARPAAGEARPFGRRLRIAADHFDYSFLKERKLYQIMGNFKLLVGDQVQAAPGAWKNHGTRVLLEGKPILTMEYASLADLEKETRWLLTLQSLKVGM